MVAIAHRLSRAATWARIGYAARGIVYLLLGGAIIATGRGASNASTFAMIFDLPAGAIWLAVIALGLALYGLFRLYEAAFDLERRGDDPGGRLARAGRAIGGLGYFALSFVAARTLAMGHRAPSEGAATRTMARELVAQSGHLGLVAVALILFGVAIAQARRAVVCDFWWQCHGAPAAVRQLGRAGFAARALVIFLVGWFALRAGVDPQRSVRGLEGTLAAIRDHRWLVYMIGAGLALFGLFSLALARWRHIPKGEGLARVRDAASL